MIPTFRLCVLGLLASRLFFGVATAGQDPQPFPSTRHIKGLQVQMVDDALNLGIQHAGVNFALHGLVAKPDDAQAFTWDSGGRAFRFARGYVESIDQQVKPLSEAGVVVYVIVLAMPTKDPAVDALLLHPKANADRSFPVGAFNTESEEGRAWLRAAFEFLTDRYSGNDATHGRVWGWIIGNEVDSHYMWHNRGPSTLEELTDGYEKAVRIAHESLRKASANARLFLSFDHQWAQANTPDRPMDSVPGRSLLDAFAKLARERGDFDWNIAWHPYHSNLFAAELWNDPAAPGQPDAPKVTFSNLEILCQHLEQPDLQWQGKPRHVILSEQGFHNELTPEGEQLQAAAYAYAWEKCRRLPMIDAFIYHRQVDHSQEGGLRLGLWRNAPNSIVTPHSTKPIYDVFRKAGTPEWDITAQALLPLTGLKSWNDLLPAP
jgi:hypothetical protein